MAETHVEIKESAIEKNQAVKEYAAQHGSLVTFQSLADAEDFAGEMTAAGEQPVGLQNTAPQDTTDADLYLVYQPTRQTHTPYEPEADTWTFDVTANQYGAIGEALITAPGVPALRHYVEEHLAPDASDIHVSSKSVYWALQDGTLTEETLDGLHWSPDAVVFAYGGPTRSLLQEYWCEIKAGDASFERRQLADMAELATRDEISVLKIRVWIDELPDQYSVRIESVRSE